MIVRSLSFVAPGLLLATLVVAQGTTPPAPAARAAAASEDARRATLQAKFDELVRAANFPGANVAFAWSDGRELALSSGSADRETQRALTPRDRMFTGSAGKTFFAALALELVAAEKLELDAPISRWLGTEPWIARLPNAKSITVRMLMNHTSGLVRYELDERFTADLAANPDRVWSIEERLKYLFDTTAPFEAGKGWDYSDTNYIVLGALLEKLCERSLYDEVRARFLEPLALADTEPATRRDLTRCAQGYAGAHDPLRIPDRVFADGRYAVNPQFEWTGGGFVTTARDLARWSRALYGGDVLDANSLARMQTAVDAPGLGRNVKYGLGVIVRETPHGRTLGHSGFFPGYVTEMGWLVDAKLAFALQVNSSDFASWRRAPSSVLAELVALAVSPEFSGSGATSSK
ncbi:MAG: beta-lactamase family protein [Planctomycetes bacterium]|nr:beta-lactamase family protein [Planctomycetota bacterium]